MKEIETALEQWILSQPNEKRGEQYVTAYGKTYTMNEILTEIRNQTDFGKKIVRNIITLTIELIARGKKQLNNA